MCEQVPGMNPDVKAKTRSTRTAVTIANSGRRKGARKHNEAE